MRYWLMKSEPDVYSIDDLAQESQTLWDGVRNYQARNFLKEMKTGDRVFFYHSNSKPPGIVGLMTILAENIVDPTQFDPKNPYYDPKSSPDNPRWHTVKVEFCDRFSEMIPLDTLKAEFSPEALWVVRRGNRLSVMPVEAAAAEKLLQLSTPASA
jgi:predicted RNA-binding protein with PUA-like domain